MNVDIKVIVGTIVIVLIGLGLMLMNSERGFGGADDLQATGATASTTAFTLAKASEESIIATSTNCSARIISTGQDGDLHLTFRDGDTPTATAGVLQTASTTAIYENDVFGCGMIRAFSSEIDTISIMNIN